MARCFTMTTMLTALPRLSDWVRHQWPSLILGAVLIALVFNGLIGLGGPRDLLVLRRHCTRLALERMRLEARRTKLEALVQNLRSNDRYLEHLIRRELGYARPNELVYKFTGERQLAAP
jgi:cell division protein FtsB